MNPPPRAGSSGSTDLPESSRGHHLLSGFILLLVVVVQTWPLVRDLGTAIPGSGPGDNATFLWNFWWMRRVGLHPFAFLSTKYLFWPFGENLVLHTHTMLEAFVGATLLRPWTIVEAQNLIILASMMLNAVTVYALAYHVTRNRAGALLAGILFAGAPYFAAHLEGHFNLICAWVIPLWLLAAARALRTGRAVDSVLAGAALAAAAYTDYYYLVYAVTAEAVLLWATRTNARVDCERRSANFAATAAVWLLAAALACLIVWIHWTGGATWRIGSIDVSLRGTFNLRIAFWAMVAGAVSLRWRFAIRRNRIDPSVARRDAFVAATIGGAFCAAIVPLAVAGARLIQSGDYIAPPTFFRSASPGVDLLALAAGNPRHPIAGNAVRALHGLLHIDAIEGMAWLGVVPAVCGWLGWRRWRNDAERRAWGWLFAVFLIWALGPFLVVGGRNTALVLPQTILRYIPIVSNARIPSRAIVCVYLAVAVFSAMGVAARSARRPWLAPVLILLTMADYASVPIPLWTVDVPSVYRTLRTRTDDGALLELPMGFQDGFGVRGSPDPAAPWHQTMHEHPVVGGSVSRIPQRVRDGYANDAIFGPLLRASEAGSGPVTLPAANLLREGLRERGVRYVILRRSAAPAPIVSLIEEAFGPSRLARDEDRELFEVRAN